MFASAKLVGLVRDGLNGESHKFSEEESAPVKVGNGFPQHTENVQEQPPALDLTPDITYSSSSSTNPRSMTELKLVIKELKDLQSKQEVIPRHVEGPPIFPSATIFLGRYR